MKMQGGLWIRQTKDGRTFLSGPGPLGMQIFVNKVEKKTSDKAPDYIITMEMPREKQESKDDGSFDNSPGF